MPKKCCISNCRIEQDSPVGRYQSFFKIPNDLNEKRKWYDSIGKEISIQWTKYLYVCSLHFEENSYTYTETNVRRIKKGCYPTIFTDFKSKRKQDALQQQTENTDEDICSTDVNDLDTQDEMEFNDSKIGIIPEISIETKECVQDGNNSFKSKDINIIYRLKQSNECDRISSNCHFNDNIPTKTEENSLVTDCLQLEETFKKSISDIDLSSIAFTSENLPKLKRLFFKAHKEVTDLRRRMKANRTNLYRYKKKCFKLQNMK